MDPQSQFYYTTGAPWTPAWERSPRIPSDRIPYEGRRVSSTGAQSTDCQAWSLKQRGMNNKLLGWPSDIRRPAESLKPGERGGFDVGFHEDTHD